MNNGSVKYVLFVCIHNAGRSQMAQALFERYAPADVRAESAGADPARAVWPEVFEVMRELEVDLPDRKPKRLSVEMQLHADWAVTMGCGDACRTSRRPSTHGMCPTRPDSRSTRSARSATRSTRWCEGSRRTESTRSAQARLLIIPD
ncbi:MAG: arsenate reductase/protein-tyrosine-phosphatase family protein [Solirubrobacteraceae bacterium]